MFRIRRCAFSVAALTAFLGLGLTASTTDLRAGTQEKRADVQCPSVALDPDVKIIAVSSGGEGADGQVPVVPSVESTCSDICDSSPLLKTIEIDEPGKVFLVLRPTQWGSAHLLWKPVAAEGTRIVGAVTFSPSVKVYLPPGILSPTQLSPVAQQWWTEFAAACGVDLHSPHWLDDSVKAIAGRKPDRQFQAVDGRRGRGFERRYGDN